MDCSPPGSSVPGILQAGILEWVAMLSSGGPPDPGIKPASPESPALQMDSLPTEPSGSPYTQGDYWQVRTQCCPFVFYFLVALYFGCFFFPVFPLLQFDSFLWGFLFPLKDFCVWSIFIFCCFHEVCIKHLIDKIVVFLLKASYPHLHLSSSFMILLTQMTLFYIANFSFNLHAMLV